MPTTNSMIDRLLHHATTNPTHDALVTSGFTLSYLQLSKVVQAQARALIDAGISDSSVVGIQCADDARHLVLSLSAIYVGATACTIPTFETAQSRKAIIERCRTTHVLDENSALDITSPQHDGKPMAESPQARLMFSTSGTTGEPKLVVHHDSDLVAQAHRHIESIQERFACLATMEHNFAKRHRLYCVAAGASNVILDANQDVLVQQCQSLDVNVLHVSAFQAQELLAAPDIHELSSIRLKLGGSHVSETLRQQLRSKVTKNLQAGYGTTETGAIAFTDPTDSGSEKSVGRALPGIEVATVSPKRTRLGTGKVGELAIRCEGMFREYSGNPELSAAKLDDGWFYTGDIGHLDDEQRIHLAGRSDDMFVFNSMNIYPQEIESEIRQYPGVTDAVVLPRKSTVHDNIPVALVVFAKDKTPNLSELNKFLRERVGVRCPRQITQVDEIPRAASGKISRGESVSLATRNDQIRGAIVRALQAHEKTQLTASLVTAFENGEKDLNLRAMDVDSLARMDLLIMLEVDYGIVVTPDEFSKFDTLGEISSWALTQPSLSELERKASAAIGDTHTAAHADDTAPYIVRFFQRTFHCCTTVAQLNKALMTLDHRLTPLEVECLHERYLNGLLIPENTAKKYQTALSLWFQSTTRMMRDSGKRQAERFDSRRIMPTITHFFGPGPTADKTLVICFSGNGDRQLLMPNSVLMQHTDCTQYDLLVIAEPLKRSYRLGVPLLGGNATEVCESINRLALINDYKHVRTIGCSAGAYPAVIAAHLLSAEMAVSVGGRFHSERYPHRILDRIISTWRAVRKGRCRTVLMSYAADMTRDRNYARVIGWLTGGHQIGVEFSDGNVGHLILKRLAERGELAPFLTHTIFAKLDDALDQTERTRRIMSFPSAKLRSQA